MQQLVRCFRIIFLHVITPTKVHSATRRGETGLKAWTVISTQSYLYMIASRLQRQMQTLLTPPRFAITTSTLPHIQVLAQTSYSSMWSNNLVHYIQSASWEVSARHQVIKKKDEHKRRTGNLSQVQSKYTEQHVSQPDVMFCWSAKSERNSSWMTLTQNDSFHGIPLVTPPMPRRLALHSPLPVTRWPTGLYKPLTYFRVKPYL